MDGGNTMGAVGDGFYKEPRECAGCHEITNYSWYVALCMPCFIVEYLKFRYAMDWPLDEHDKKRLGLI